MQKLVLGTVQFGLDYGINNKSGKPSFDEVKRILDFAYLNNIKFLDTAEAYGNSHEVIGKYHREEGSYRFKIITKFSSDKKNFPLNIYERVLKNIEELGVESIYCYMIHSFDDYQKYFNTFENDLSLLKKEGKIIKIGVSLYDNFELEKVLENDAIELVQIPFNLLDNNSKRKEVLELAKQANVEVHTRSVFLQGLFFKNKNDFSGNLKNLLPYVDNIKEISETYSIPVPELAINYPMNQENINQVLIGVDNLEQLIKNIDNLSGNLPNEVFDEIDKIDVEELDLLNPSKWKD